MLASLHPSKGLRLLVAVLAISALVGAAAAKLNTRGELQVAAATTHALVDYPDAPVLERRALPQDVTTLQKRAELYARMLVTKPVLEAVGRRAGLPPEAISGVARTTANVPIRLLEAGSEERANLIRASRAPYRLESQSYPGEPIFAIYSEAPSFDEAQRLANGAILGLQDHLRSIARAQGFPERSLPRIQQLGAARGGVTNGKARILIAALTFGTAFALTALGLLALAVWWRRRSGAEVPPRRAATRLTGYAAADWPRTTRVLPWSVAGFITMLWLTPFDKIRLAMTTPVDITLDRIVLPVIVVIWLIAFTAGPGAAPRLRLTRVHVAIGAFLTCAFLSVVLDARYLNQTGELMLSLKKLPLLVSYISVFVIVASSIRRSEVQAFLTYSLVLAVVCGLAVVYEYRFRQNLFNTLSSKLFAGPFELVLDGDGSGVDALGRRWVVGPAAFGVEMIAMMSMALPIAVVGLMQSETRRRKLIYGLAIAVLFAAMFATQRKSSLLAPAAVVVTLAYFRRRELLSLAPLGLGIAVLVAFISPGAVQGVVSQFTRPDASRVATVSDRTSDYDAIRPDAWSHLLFGRGYGSYAPDTFRILDSEILGRIVETGTLGLLTFILIPLSVILAVRRSVSTADARWASPALCSMAAAVCLLVVATLYDVMGPPHAPMLFLTLAGLAVVVVAREAGEPDPAPTRRSGWAVPVHGRRPAGPLREPAFPAAAEAEVLATRGR